MNALAMRSATKPDPAAIPRCLEKFYQEYSSLKDAEIVRAIADCVSVTVEQLLRAAALVRLAYDRGQDLRPQLPGFLKTAANIAFGQLDPDLAGAFADRPRLLQRLARLPLQDQKKLLKEDGVDIAVPRGDGGAETVHVSLSQLREKDATKAIGPDRLIGIAEQTATLKRNGPSFTKLSGIPRFVEINRRSGEAKIGDHILSAAQLAAILAALSGGK